MFLLTISPEVFCLRMVITLLLVVIISIVCCAVGLARQARSQGDRSRLHQQQLMTALADARVWAARSTG
jgi:hypothetical protein